MSAPRLSIGLPVYNNGDLLAESIEALLGQTFGDFELILSSNASTDQTDDICRDYVARDSRVRYYRQRANLGAVPNHYFVLDQARGELFKWASGDDLYARDLLERCIRLLDEHPGAVLAHSWTAAIDADGALIQAHEYPLDTDAATASARLRSLLFAGDDLPGAIRADDFYGVMRTKQLRGVKPHGSFYHADQVFTADLALQGSFAQVPAFLYFRRHHPGRAHQAKTTAHDWCANLEPRRASRLRNPAVRLVGEYVWGYYAAVRRSSLPPQEKRRCYAEISRWLTSRGTRRLPGRTPEVDPAQVNRIAESVDVRAVVPGQSLDR